MGTLLQAIQAGVIRQAIQDFLDILHMVIRRHLVPMATHRNRVKSSILQRRREVEARVTATAIAQVAAKVRKEKVAAVVTVAKVVAKVVAAVAGAPAGHARIDEEVGERNQRAQVGVEPEVGAEPEVVASADKCRK